MAMKNPPHPGHSLHSACLAPLGLSVTEAARALGYPVVMKIVSPQIVHKSDVGGVALGIIASTRRA